MSFTSQLLCISVCALAGGALLHSMRAASGEVALASYQRPPGAVGGDNSPPPYSSLMTAPASPPPVLPAPSVRWAAPAFHPGAESLVITSCNGVLGSANLRSQPSLDPGVVLSVIPQGEPVLVLGDWAWGDGEVWIYIRTANRQEGWIAACFERG